MRVWRSRRCQWRTGIPCVGGSNHRRGRNSGLRLLGTGWRLWLCGGKPSSRPCGICTWCFLLKLWVGYLVGYVVEQFGCLSSRADRKVLSFWLVDGRGACSGVMYSWRWISDDELSKEYFVSKYGLLQHRLSSLVVQGLGWPTVHTKKVDPTVRTCNARSKH